MKYNNSLSLFSTFMFVKFSIGKISWNFDKSSQLLTSIILSAWYSFILVNIGRPNR